MMRRGVQILWGFTMVCLVVSGWGQSENPLQDLSKTPDFESQRVSSYDRSGGNQDWISIEPGETKVLADLEGPGAITHFWNTIDAEKYYPRMLILRFYWDGQETPSVEVPLGDFFGVGHGLNRSFQSMAVNASSDGRARNCYWYMPFRKSAKVTVTHEGLFAVSKFYYAIDYRKYASLPEDSLYFHAHYHQATPNPSIELQGKNPEGKTNYLLAETTGKGQYIGSVVSVQMNEDGWFGEGDDMFFVDGSSQPTLIGTGTEDYFNDAWGFREFSYPYHGVTLWEGYKKGDRGTAYRWHVYDPIAFHTSLKATLEHGHANDRTDDWYSVAFWYQTLPSPPVPLMASVFDRLPDEGQVYTRRLFLNKELSLRIEQGKYQDALDRIEEYLRDNASADSFGYWSLRKGMLLKQSGDLMKAKESLSAASQKSETDAVKAVECDAKSIHQFAQREYDLVDTGKSVWCYLACAGSYELWIDGKSVATGSGWESLNEVELKLSRGKHLIAVRAKSNRSKSGFLLQFSSRNGYEMTDSTWKASTILRDNWEQMKFDDASWKEAESVGTPGVSDWMGSRPEYQFVSGLLLSKYIWATDGQNEGQTVYFRKIIQIR